LSSFIWTLCRDHFCFETSSMCQFHLFRINRIHILDEIDDTVRVAPFVVVPSDELEEVRVQRNRRIDIEHARASVAVDVGRHDLLVSDADQSLKIRRICVHTQTHTHCTSSKLNQRAVCELPAAARSALTTPSIDVGFDVLNVRSTAETSAVGTRNAMPVSLPLTAGIASATALAAPVDAGTMFCGAPRPDRHFLSGPSTVCDCQHIKTVSQIRRNPKIFHIPFESLCVRVNRIILIIGENGVVVRNYYCYRSWHARSS
jgi:hypothetical protein